MPRLRLLRQSSSPDIELQRRMKQSRLRELFISLLPCSHEMLLRNAVSQVLVQLLVVADTQARHGNPPVFRWVVVTGPDAHVVRAAEKLLRRVE